MENRKILYRYTSFLLNKKAHCPKQWAFFVNFKVYLLCK